MIPGLILVALMVYLSTRIKRTAAEAFAREEIDTGEFSLVKPEGFINPVKDASEYAFEAYSKDYGRDAAGNLPQASITVKRHGSDLESVYESARGSLTDPETIGSDGDEFVVRGRGTEGSTAAEVYYKLVRAGSAVYEFRTCALTDHAADFRERLRQTADSFAVRPR